MYIEHEPASPLIRCLWEASGEESGEWSVAASEYWGLGFARSRAGVLTAALAGPSLVPREGDFTAGDHHWGVEFEAHVFWRGLPKTTGDLVPLPVDGGWFVLAGVRYPVPDVHGLERLVASLVGQGVLTADATVAQALAGDDPPVSDRTLQRIVPRTTGLRRVQITQLQRARDAYRRLQDGVPLATAAADAGYADQAHMTRAFRQFVGLSPARILAGDGGNVQEDAAPFRDP